jgi:hypothetical protein
MTAHRIRRYLIMTSLEWRVEALEVLSESTSQGGGWRQDSANNADSFRQE